MSGQVLSVSGEKVVCVSYPGHSYICANFKCNNLIGNFELMKLAQKKISTTRCKEHYCVKCRRSGVEKVRCESCLNGFFVSNGRTSMARLCSDCKRGHHDESTKAIQKELGEAIKWSTKNRICRVCGGASGKYLDCSDQCKNKWHAMIRRKNDENMINEIKANRFCNECSGPIDKDADFRVRYCSGTCKKKSHAKLFVLYRKEKKQIELNKGTS